MDLLQVSPLLIAIAVATSILLPARGSGLSSTFGGESTAYRSRRGIERALFRLTVVLVAGFIIISLLGSRQPEPAAWTAPRPERSRRPSSAATRPALSVDPSRQARRPGARRPPRGHEHRRDRDRSHR